MTTQHQQVTRLVDAQAAQTERIRSHLGVVVAASVASFTGWYTTAEITNWATRLARVSEAAQRQVASLTDAYLTRVLNQLVGRPVKPSGTIQVADLRKGVTHPGVYGRLADQYRYEVSAGTDKATVLKHVEERARVIVDTDLQLAEQQQERKFMVVHSVDGWRRVFHPELSKGGSCGLCIAASDRVYKVGDLKPLHSWCKCTVVPIINGVDVGSQINADDLSKLYDAAGGSTSAANLKKTRYKVNDHGELGPVLTATGAAFRTPADVAAATRPAA